MDPSKFWLTNPKVKRSWTACSKLTLAAEYATKKVPNISEFPFTQQITGTSVWRKQSNKAG